MPKKDIRVIRAEDLGIELPETSVSEEQVRDVTSYFGDDVKECNRQLVEAEKFYSELHGLWDNLTGGDYMPTKSVRDVAELGKTMVSARSLCSDIAHKRHQVRKSVSDIVNKKVIEEDSSDANTQTARALLALIRDSRDITPPQQNRVITPSQQRDQDLSALDARVNKCISKGAIKMSTNDKLVGISEHVRFEFDKMKKVFVAIDTRNGSIIAGFPKERFPTGRITKIADGQVYTSNGEVFPIRGAKKSED